MLPTHRDLAYEEVLMWLSQNGLTDRGSTYDKTPEEGRLFDGTEVSVLGMPSHRAEAKTRAQLKQLRDNAGKHATEISDKERWSRIWSELRNPEAAVRQLDVSRIPADAIAFYRPFHFEPFDQWGIYILIPPLLTYCSQLRTSLGTLSVFSPSVLASMVLFEIFHHEFFHHLVECTAASIEILWSAPDRPPIPIYLQYRHRTWERALGAHSHDPLEEALANAYAFNSFSFISRVGGGYLEGTSRIYQKALERNWKHEPPGYREAGSYVRGGQLEGARMLVQRMLSTVGPCQELPIRMLVDAVFPRGHTAFWQKPDIPTYLVGTQPHLDAFAALVPAPNETYSSLFWPADTDALDKFIKEQKQKEREARRQKRPGNR